jgi:hypothetical protein
VTPLPPKGFLELFSLPYLSEECLSFPLRLGQDSKVLLALELLMGKLGFGQLAQMLVVPLLLMLGGGFTYVT